MIPQYDLDKIKFATDGPTFERAVGGFVYEVVDMLKEYAKLDSTCIKVFKKLCGQSTCFGWEELLVKIFDEHEK